MPEPFCACVQVDENGKPGLLLLQRSFLWRCWSRSPAAAPEDCQETGLWLYAMAFTHFDVHRRFGLELGLLAARQVARLAVYEIAGVGLRGRSVRECEFGLLYDLLSSEWTDTPTLSWHCFTVDSPG